MTPESGLPTLPNIPTPGSRFAVGDRGYGGTGSVYPQLMFNGEARTRPRINRASGGDSPIGQSNRNEKSRILVTGNSANLCILSGGINGGIAQIGESAK